MAKKILLTSFKGGTGVTTFAVGLGLALAGMGERTLIIDGDTVTGGAEIIGGCRDGAVYTLADYEKGACRAKQTLVAHPACTNLLFSPSVNLKDLSVFERAAADLDGLFDYVLLDEVPVKTFDRAIIVTEPYAPSVKSADARRSSLADAGVTDVSLAVNKLSPACILNGESMTAYEISALLRLKLAAVIPEDLTLPFGKVKNRTRRAFKTAGENISGRRDGVTNVLRGFGGIGGFIKRKTRDKL